MIVVVLVGIVLAACVFAALLWSLYRATGTTGGLRIAYVILTLSTILVVAAVTWNFVALTLAAGLTCAISGAIAVWNEHRWSKLLPLVQVILGGMSVWAGTTILL